MDKPLVINSLKQTCTACPSQWDAEAENDSVKLYIRYRHGWLSVTRSTELEPDPVMGEAIFEGSFGDGFDGVMSTQEMLERIKQVAIFPNYQEESQQSEDSELLSLSEELGVDLRTEFGSIKDKQP